MSTRLVRRVGWLEDGVVGAGHSQPETMATRRVGKACGNQTTTAGSSASKLIYIQRGGARIPPLTTQPTFIPIGNPSVNMPTVMGLSRRNPSGSSAHLTCIDEMGHRAHPLGEYWGAHTFRVWRRVWMREGFVGKAEGI